MQGEIISDIAVIMIALYFPLWCFLDMPSFPDRKVTAKQIAEFDKRENEKDEKRIKDNPNIREPYDTKAFREQPLNFDIDGFWKSYTRSNLKK